MTKTADLDVRRNERVFRGTQAAKRATSRGHRVADTLGNDVEPVLEWLFDGARVEETDDGVKVIIGGGTGGSGTNSGTNTVTVMNNSGRDLIPGDVVVTDETADKAVTTTTTPGDDRVPGVVQEPIAAGALGKVLFAGSGGFVADINAPDAMRGEFAITSDTETVADSVTTRKRGTFAVYLTGADLPDFASAGLTTTSDLPVESMLINLPPAIPINRELFLALWLDDSAMSIDLPGWSRIGSTAGFYYFTRVSTGLDFATATWTNASVAVATVLLLHPSVLLAAPVEDFDYDATTSAAAVTGLADVAHYALAGVDADVTPGSGFTRLAGGTADFLAGGTPTLVQNSGIAEDVVSFGSPVTAGNVVVAVTTRVNELDVWMSDPREGGACPPASWMVQMARGANSRVADASVTSIIAGISADTYAGPFRGLESCFGGWDAILMLEFSNLNTAGYQSVVLDDQTASSVDLGLTAGSDDVTIVSITNRNSGDPGVAPPAGFTTLANGPGFALWYWIGYRIGAGGTVFNFGNQDSMGIAAVVLTGGGSHAEGTLAGAYIGHDSSATSPFTGGSQQNDAIFAVTLLADAKPSALLYGPDLGSEEGGGMTPYFIPDGETFTVPLYKQALFSEAIDGPGTLDVIGMLIEVD